MVGWPLTHWTWFEQTLRDSEGDGSWHAAVHGIAKSQT